MNKNPQNLVWIDLEMTGLNTFKDRIIEIATIVTDKELNILEEGPVIAIQTPIEDIELVNRWYPDKKFKKDPQHIALEDIKDSIEELKHYRNTIFLDIA